MTTTRSFIVGFLLVIQKHKNTNKNKNKKDTRNNGNPSHKKAIS